MSRLGRLQPQPPIVVRLPLAATFLAGAVTGPGVGTGSVIAGRTDAADVAGVGVGAASVSATAADPPAPRRSLVVTDAGLAWWARQPTGRMLRVVAPTPPAGAASVDGLGVGVASLDGVRTDAGAVAVAGQGGAAVAAARGDAGDVAGVGLGSGLVAAVRVDVAAVAGAGVGAGVVAGGRSDTAALAGVGTGAAAVTASASGGGALVAGVLGVGVGAGEITSEEYWSSTGGWDTLLAVSQYARQLRAEDLARPPVACPNDGEPLRTAPDGGLWCPWDGWRPGP